MGAVLLRCGTTSEHLGHIQYSRGIPSLIYNRRLRGKRISMRLLNTVSGDTSCLISFIEPSLPQRETPQDEEQYLKMCPRCRTGTATLRLLFRDCVKLDHHWGFIRDTTKNITRVGVSPEGHISMSVGCKPRSTVNQTGLNSWN